jgi:hypothetical protein
MGSLEAKVNLDTAQKRFDYSPCYTSVFPMALVPHVSNDGKVGLGVLRERDEPLHSVADDTLEQIVKYLGGDDQQARDTVQAKYSSYVLKQFDDEFRESGKYNRLAGWCHNNGLNVPEAPKYFESVSRDDDAVAWTKIGEQTTGIDAYLDEKVEKLSQSSGLSKDQAVELLQTHEYMHNAQDISDTTDVLLIESDNELNLAKYFYHTAFNSEDSSAKERYFDLTNVCLGRYLGIMAAYLKQQGTDIELNQDSVNQLLNDSGFIEYAQSQAHEEEADSQDGESAENSSEETAEYSEAA